MGPLFISLPRRLKLLSPKGERNMRDKVKP
jgi:hypothetical protein